MLSRVVTRAALIVLVAQGAFAQCDHPKPLLLAPGTSQATTQGDLVRGELACLTVRAKAGQTLTMTTDSPEKNAVFQIYSPGWTVRLVDGEPVIDGASLPGAADGEDTSRWQGLLRQDGNNLVVVGTTRGGGHYVLTLGLR